jgi:hypothetical protein
MNPSNNDINEDTLALDNYEVIGGDYEGFNMANGED